MIELSSDCIKLDAGVCSGALSVGRWFCAREIYPYWRECWLERVDRPVDTDSSPESVVHDHADVSAAPGVPA